jgi:hypothetical protein
VDDLSTPAVPDPAAAAAAVDDDADYPVAWKKDYRPHWKTVPKEVREEIARREQAMMNGMRATEAARRTQHELDRIVAPYMDHIKAENSTPMVAVENMLKTAHALRTATTQDKARLIAGLVQRFGVDIGMLDSELASHLSPDGKSRTALSEMVQQEMQPVRQFMSSMQQQRQMAEQQATQRVAQDMGEFAKSHQHFDTLRIEMADLIEVADRQGQSLTLQDAYDRALWANPQTRSEAMRQKQLEVAKQQNEQAEAAKRKAASVAGAPVQSGAQGNSDTVRDAIESAWNRHAG